MARNTISIIMSVHNGARYLREAISSILNQTEKEFEFVIVDDASTDESESIISSYKDPRIVFIKNPQNLGLTKSLNIALRKSTGTYIARMDADDISLPERLAIQKNFLDVNPEISCVGSAITIINEHGATIGNKAPPTDPDILQFNILLKNQMIHPSVMFRRNIGEYDERIRYAQDYALWSSLIQKGVRFSNVKDTLLKYRQHGHSVTQGSSKDAAYQSAKNTVIKNIQHYISAPDKDIHVFVEALHMHHIPSFTSLWTAESILYRFAVSYKKQSPAHIHTYVDSYITRERNGMIRWYARKRFAILYPLITLWRSLSR